MAKPESLLPDVLEQFQPKSKEEVLRRMEILNRRMAMIPADLESDKFLLFADEFLDLVDEFKDTYGRKKR